MPPRHSSLPLLAAFVALAVPGVGRCGRTERPHRRGLGRVRQRRHREHRHRRLGTRGADHGPSRRGGPGVFARRHPYRVRASDGRRRAHALDDARRRDRRSCADPAGRLRPAPELVAGRPRDRLRPRQRRDRPRHLGDRRDRCQPARRRDARGIRQRTRLVAGRDPHRVHDRPLWRQRRGQREAGRVGPAPPDPGPWQRSAAHVVERRHDPRIRLEPYGRGCHLDDEGGRPRAGTTRSGQCRRPCAVVLARRQLDRVPARQRPLDRDGERHVARARRLRPDQRHRPVVAGAARSRHGSHARRCSPRVRRSGATSASRSR